MERQSAGGTGNTPKKPKKSVLLRIDGDLWEEIAAWAEDEFRSVNGQMEFLLHEAVKERRKHRGKEG
ncbi:MAG: hypothetical protein ABF449_03865 [Ethanoligenens sp.]